MTLWALLGAPFAEAMLLVGIHTYLGLHVLRRGIIFVDLALAQVAALGGLLAFLVGLEPGSTGAAVFSLVFALGGAAVLSLLRPKPESRVPQEALIGLVYAMASSIAILVMAKAPEGASELQETLTGALLWVRWETVGHAALTYGAVALLHIVFQKPLLRVSEDARGAAAAGVRVGLWDFLFYGTFAVVVTHSVATAGVLLVFVFLVAPAVLALLTFRSFRAQLLFGWAIGLLVCVGGLWLSYATDLPTGPMVVGVYAAVLALAGLYRWLRPEPGRPGQPLRRGAALVAGLLAFGAALELARSLSGEAPSHAAASTEPAPAAPQPGQTPQAPQLGTALASAAVPASALAAAPGPSPADLEARALAARVAAAGSTPSAPENAPPSPGGAAQPAEAEIQALIDRVQAADLPDEKRAACAQETDARRIQSAAGRAQDAYDRLALAQCLVARAPDDARALLTALAADTTQPALVRDEAQRAAQASPSPPSR